MIHIIANIVALEKKKSSCLETVKEVLDGAGCEYRIYMTAHKGHASEIARVISSDGAEHTIVAVGGDGTLHEILNGVEDPSKCTLGLIPFGTGNDFASCVSLPADTRKAAELIAAGKPSYVDYIRLSGGLRSINAVGTGIDVDVLKRAYSGKRRGKIKYLIASVVSLLRFKCYEFTAEVDGEVSEHFGMLTCIGNGRQIGGGIRLFPNYDVTDGYLEFTMIDYTSRVRSIYEFTKILMGRLRTNDIIHLMKAKKIKITCKNTDYTIQAEGELYDNVPLEAEAVHEELRFFLP